MISVDYQKQNIQINRHNLDTLSFWSHFHCENTILYINNINKYKIINVHRCKETFVNLCTYLSWSICRILYVFSLYNKTSFVPHREDKFIFSLHCLKVITSLCSLSLSGCGCGCKIFAGFFVIQKIKASWAYTLNGLLKEIRKHLVFATCR